MCTERRKTMPEKSIDKKQKKNKKYMCEDAFLTNNVASSTDATGFAVTIPRTDEEAEGLSEMFNNVPVEPIAQKRRQH